MARSPPWGKFLTFSTRKISFYKHTLRGHPTLIFIFLPFYTTFYKCYPPPKKKKIKKKNFFFFFRNSEFFFLMAKNSEFRINSENWHLWIMCDKTRFFTHKINISSHFVGRLHQSHEVREAIEIGRRGAKTLNREEGTYLLSHVYDYSAIWINPSAKTCVLHSSNVIRIIVAQHGFQVSAPGRGINYRLLKIKLCASSWTCLQGHTLIN